MPTKRAILSELSAGELRAGVDLYELEVDDRRVKADLADALATSRKARIDTILEPLSRKRLKVLCRALNLDDSGRRKSDIIARLTGASGPAKESEAPKSTRKGDGGEPPQRESTDMERAVHRTPDTLTFEQLKNHVWSAADILRGSIDSSDYKSFILGLLFVKRLSDRFEEEAEKLIARGMPEDVAWTDPDEHQFFVPERARWSTIQKGAGLILSTPRMLESVNSGAQRGAGGHVGPIGATLPT